MHSLWNQPHLHQQLCVFSDFHLDSNSIKTQRNARQPRWFTKLKTRFVQQSRDNFPFNGDEILSGIGDENYQATLGLRYYNWACVCVCMCVVCAWIGQNSCVCVCACVEIHWGKCVTYIFISSNMALKCSNERRCLYGAGGIMYAQFHYSASPSWITIWPRATIDVWNFLWGSLRKKNPDIYYKLRISMAPYDST